jgi:hypothetical protein
MNIREIGWGGGVDWMHLAQGPLAGSCEHGNETSDYIKAGNFLTSRVTVSF